MPRCQVKAFLAGYRKHSSNNTVMFIIHIFQREGSAGLEPNVLTQQAFYQLLRLLRSIEILISQAVALSDSRVVNIIILCY